MFIRLGLGVGEGALPGHSGGQEFQYLRCFALMSRCDTDQTGNH